MQAMHLGCTFFLTLVNSEHPTTQIHGFAGVASIIKVHASRSEHCYSNNITATKPNSLLLSSGRIPNAWCYFTVTTTWLYTYDSFWIQNTRPSEMDIHFSTLRTKVLTHSSFYRGQSLWNSLPVFLQATPKMF